MWHGSRLNFKAFGVKLDAFSSYFIAGHDEFVSLDNVEQNLDNVFGDCTEVRCGGVPVPGTLLHRRSLLIVVCPRQILLTMIEVVEVMNAAVTATTSDGDRVLISRALLAAVRLIELTTRHDKYRIKVLLPSIPWPGGSDVCGCHLLVFVGWLISLIRCANRWVCWIAWSTCWTTSLITTA